MIVDQFLHALSPSGDGIADYVRAIQNYLRKQGHQSNIYVHDTLPQTAHETLPLQSYQPDQGGMILFHYFFETPLVNHFIKHHLRVQLLFHNITPPKFFAEYDNAVYQSAIRGLEQLHNLIPCTDYAVGNSKFTESELRQIGFKHTGTFILDIPHRFKNITPEPILVPSNHFLLFVGRLATNKRAEDLIKLLWFCRQLEPELELYLVGSSTWTPPTYIAYLQQLLIELQLETGVHFCGHVTQSELATYYQTARVFVSMSEHEGFGIPLVESMFHDLPVVAYASTAVTEVVEDAGILIRHKRFEEWAMLLYHLMKNESLRQTIIKAQRQRLLDYSEEKFEQAIERIIAIK